MIWLLLLAGAVGARVILATLRRREQTTLTKALLFEFAVRRTAAGPPSRRDRLWTGVASILTAAACIAAGAGLITWADHFPNLSTSNHILSGLGFVLAILGTLVALSGLLELLRAPFAPRGKEARDA
jgi:hypothetical protein